MLGPVRLFSIIICAGELGQASSHRVEHVFSAKNAESRDTCADSKISARLSGFGEARGRMKVAQVGWWFLGLAVDFQLAGGYLQHVVDFGAKNGIVAERLF